MDNTLMKVTQLPVIEEHLRSRKEQTERRVAEAMSLVCTDETLTSVKNIRAEMNREFADAETQRKADEAMLFAGICLLLAAVLIAVSAMM